MKIETIANLTNNKRQAKPFMKWAGGKRQLLPVLEENLPKILKETKSIELYIEPFIGGGAFFFYLSNNYNIKKSIIMDINEDLILTYKIVKNNVYELIKLLKRIEKKYIEIETEIDRSKFFYIKRKFYNQQKNSIDYFNLTDELIKRAAYTIFLNRTCFNGLFRQNSRGEFNVPFGKYKNPKICDKENLINVSNSLKNTKIICGDFSESEKYVNTDTFIYLDPPYKPIKKTSSFTKYTKNDFNDSDQIRLANFIKKIGKGGAFILLSNSYPETENSEENYFEKLYKGYNIKKVLANRMINSNSKGRGKIFELLIKNY